MAESLVVLLVLRCLEKIRKACIHFVGVVDEYRSMHIGLGGRL